MKTLKERTLELLKNHRGKKQAIKLEKAAEDLGLFDGHLNPDTRRLQIIVKELVEVDHHPIGTSTKEPFGYYFCDTEAELKENFDAFMRRGISTINRARAFVNKAMTGKFETVTRQLGLFQEDDAA